MTLYVVGTSHHYQLGAGVSFGQRCSEADEAAFARMLKDLASNLEARVLAEEASEEAIARGGKAASVMQRVAAELGVRHLFCDPDCSERTALGIQESMEIWLSAPDEQAVPRLEEESRNRREREWLRRLEDVGSQTVIFVCGANHISTLIPLLQDQAVEFSVVHADWTTSH